MSGAQFLDLGLDREIKFIRKKLINKSCESNIRTVSEEHVSSENIYTDFDIFVDDDVYHQHFLNEMSNKLKVFKHYRVVVSPEVTKLNHSLMNKCHLSPTNRSCYKTINSSILQESFSSVSKYLSCIGSIGELLLLLRSDKKDWK